jgi:hypothetical protein
MKTMTRTYLAPGQRYTDVAANPWRLDQQLTILHIGERAGGQSVVTYRLLSGGVETASAAQFEAAVAKGLIVPVVGFGRVAAC